MFAPKNLKTLYNFMKKYSTLLILLLSTVGFSQEVKSKIQTYLNSKHNEFALTTEDVSDFIMSGETSSESTKINNYFIKQRFQGIEIFNAISNVWIKNDEIINVVADRFVNNINQKVNTTTPNLSVLEALASALNKLEIQNSGNHQIIETIDAKNFKISNGNLEDPIIAELVYQVMEDTTLRLSWDFTIDTPGHQHLWSVRIDALNGAILEKNDMVISCNFENHKHGSDKSDTRISSFYNSFFKNNSIIPLDIQSGSYRVIPYNYESPNHSPRQLIVTPHNVLASPYGWHDTNGTTGNEYTTTRGNNVYAQDDNDGNDGTGVTANGGASLLFDFPYLGTTEQPSAYLNAAITNLFYMNNVIHDVWYQYGFNEVNGNFQQNNYSRGGTSGAFGDAVYADAQDGGALSPQNLNNANFSTPIDGSRPRMQMFLWNVAPSIQPLYINSPLDIAGFRDARDNSFSPGHVNIPIAPALIQSDLVLYDDGVPDTSDACSNPINASAISDHIAVIRRGDCTFASKVKLAQIAGAKAVIIVNNVAGVIGMAGSDATIVIPAISVTQEVGEALITKMATETVNATLQLQETPFVNADGDFDNGIISHEYGHGISTRLTGGPANSSCLNNAEQMGEGWSDWFALMLQLKAGDVGTTAKGIGTFAISQSTDGSGIRNFSYSTDMNINPLTFNDSNDTESHNRGEFMATVLWDLTWAYIEKYGFNSNIYTGTGGNNKVMRLVIDGLKLQPCSPTVVEFRTALIAADQATTGGQDYCLITEVFRRRGVGLTASSGSRTSATDQVENFTAFAPGPNCVALGVNTNELSDFVITPNPNKGNFTIQFKSNSNNDIKIAVYDMSGRRIFENNYENTGLFTQNIQLESIQTGVYIVNVNDGNKKEVKRIIIE